ncbi:MAG: M13 family peptidase, partial [Alistipes sp.]|nr:M13 family peptidase [Alistipes sp.]
MRKILFTIATVALMASCNQEAAKPAIDRANFDESVALNEDFYHYATGGWQKANPMKPEFSRYGVFDIMRENNEVRLNDLFASMTKSKAEKGTVEQKISDLYTMGLDSVRLNKDGVAPLKADLNQLMQISELDHVSYAAALIHKYAGSPLFSMGVGADLMNSNINALYAGQSGLGMGNRDYYLDEENAAKRKGYVEWLTKAFSLCDFEDAESSAQKVLEFETKMAKAFRTNVQLRDVEAGYNPMSKADFVKRYDAINWDVYFSEMGIGSFEQLIVGEPEVLDVVNTLLKQEPLQTIKLYLAANVIASAADYLSDDISAAKFEFF